MVLDRRNSEHLQPFESPPRRQSLERFGRRRVPDCLLRTKTIPRAKTAPASILSAPAPGYSRSFVGAPTSTTCRLRFSDCWPLWRSYMPRCLIAISSARCHPGRSSAGKSRRADRAPRSSRSSRSRSSSVCDGIPASDGSRPARRPGAENWVTSMELHSLHLSGSWMKLALVTEQQALHRAGGFESVR
jgi:hypothetical protein